MTRIKSRLNKLGRRLVRRSRDVQYLINRLSSDEQDAASDGLNPWLSPVQLPPANQIQVVPTPEEGVASESDTRDHDASDENSSRRRTPLLVGTHFLEDWSEWYILSRRFVDLAGTRTLDEFLYEVSPDRVRGVSDQVEGLVAAKGYLEAFAQTHAPNENAPTEEDRSQRNGLVDQLRQVASGDTDTRVVTPDPADLVSSIFRVGEQDLLVRGLIRHAQRHYNQVPFPLRTLQSRLGETADAILRFATPIVKENEAAARRLRAYRYSTLSLSWLLDGNENEKSALTNSKDQENGGSLINRLCREVDDNLKRAGMESGRYLRTILREGGEEGLQQRHPSEDVLRRAARTTREIGVGRFAKMVEGVGRVTGRKQDGQSALVAPNTSMQVISSNQEGLSREGTCDADVCIAFSLSKKYYPGVSEREKSGRARRARERRLDEELRKRRSELEKVLEGVQQWLADYGPTGKTVLIITDLWVPRQFGEYHASLFEGWSSRGASIFVAAPNHRGTALSLVDWTL